MGKKVVIVSDFHCGHIVGLTPPLYQYKSNKNSPAKKNKFGKIQKQCWDFYCKTIDELKPIDVLICNGDLIDGRGEMSGSTELITPNRQEQCTMAMEVINYAKSKNTKVVVLYGTAYHVGSLEDWENSIADGVKAEKIGSHEWVDVNGVVFDIKHHLSSSSLPHTRHTSIAKERLWNTIWAEHKEQPTASIIIRSHVHYYTYCGNDRFLGITTPALQAMGSKYGARRCSGHVDFGLLSFNINNKGGYVWQAHIADVRAQKSKSLKL